MNETSLWRVAGSKIVVWCCREGGAVARAALCICAGRTSRALIYALTPGRTRCAWHCAGCTSRALHALAAKPHKPRACAPRRLPLREICGVVRGMKRVLRARELWTCKHGQVQ